MVASAREEGGEASREELEPNSTDGRNSSHVLSVLERLFSL